MATESLQEVQQRLNRAGFVEDLTAKGTQLHAAQSGEDLDPATLVAAEIARVDLSPDSADQALLVAVGARDGRPVGTFVVAYGPEMSPEEAEILRHLDRYFVSAEEAAEHDTHDHIAAVFGTHADAEAAVDDLREIGLGSRHLRLAIRQPDTVVFERDEEADLAEDLEKGVAAGAVLGFIGGMLLFAIAAPGIGALGAGGIAALGLSSGFGGAMIGGFGGIGAASAEFYEHDALRHTALEPGEVLVVACSHDRPELVEGAFTRHGGKLIEPGVW